MQNNQTLEYYEKNADAYVKDTVSVDFTDVQNRFMQALKGRKILDFGCGSGRDTLYFLNAGYDVDAMDGCREFCISASQLTGIPVRHMLFQELNEIDYYDGIWACSSILHVSKKDLKDVIARMIRALHQDGIIYTSFKYGEYEGERNGRYFTDFTIERIKEFIADYDDVIIEDYWFSGDVRPGREEEKWLNLILRKISS